MLLSDLFCENDKAYNISGKKPYLWKRVIHSDFGGHLYDGWAKPLYPTVKDDLESRVLIPDSPLFARILVPKQSTRRHMFEVVQKVHGSSKAEAYEEALINDPVSLFFFNLSDGSSLHDPQIGLPTAIEPEWELVTGVDELSGASSVGWAESSGFMEEVLDGHSVWDETCYLFQDGLGRRSRSDKTVLSDTERWIEIAKSITKTFLKNFPDQLPPPIS